MAIKLKSGATRSDKDKKSIKTKSTGKSVGQQSSSKVRLLDAPNLPGSISKQHRKAPTIIVVIAIILGVAGTAGGFYAGLNTGKSQGWNDGYGAGKTDGNSEGYNSGYIAGYSAAEAPRYTGTSRVITLSQQHKAYAEGYADAIDCVFESAWYDNHADLSDCWNYDGNSKNYTGRVRISS